MAINQVFQVNSPNIVSETIDGEVVIVNLLTGDYYSLLNAATTIWNNIEQGMNRDHIVAELENIYESSSINIGDAVNDFLEKLQAEKLIVANREEQTSPQSPKSSASSNSLEKQEFVHPKFEKFTDMEDLLLLDPIHEVDEARGWPHVEKAKAIEA